MARCPNGSRKQASAPDSFTIDTGAVCFILGIDSPLCSLLDGIPSLIGQPWKKIISSVARDALGIAVSQVTDRIDTNSFCSMEPPMLPEEISYSDVFGFVASYVPPLSFVASGDNLIGKITKYYLYQKWSEYCECRKRKREPEDDENTPISPFVPKCENSAVYQQDIQLAIDDANQRNSANAGFEGNYVQFGDGDSPNQLDENAFYEFKNYYDSPEFPEFLDYRDETETNRATEFDEIQIGCLTFESRGGSFINHLIRYTIGNEETGTSRIVFLGYSTYQTLQLNYDEQLCCETPPPPPPKLPKRKDEQPEECECVPIPPPEFCVAFPDSPFCANVPPSRPPNNEDCEPTELDVDDYQCGIGYITKKVEWKL